MLIEPWSKMVKHAVPDPEGVAWEATPEERRIVIMWGPAALRQDAWGKPWLTQQALWYTKSTAPTLSLLNKNIFR